MQCSTVFVDNNILKATVPSLWNEEENFPSVFINFLSVSPDDTSLHLSLERFWKQEHTGILPAKEVAMSRDDIRAMKLMDDES